MASVKRPRDYNTRFKIELQQDRLSAGLQCPECYGVRIYNRTMCFDPQPIGFGCEECGCQFGAALP